MTSELSPVDKSAMGNLRQSELELTIAGLKRFLVNSSWIGKTNYYANDVVSRLKERRSSNNTTQAQPSAVYFR